MRHLYKFSFLLMVFCLSLNISATRFNISVSRGYETLQLENYTGYKDQTSALLNNIAMDLALHPNFAMLLNFESGSTKDTILYQDYSHPLELLKGHYNRQAFAFKYYFGKDAFRLGLGLGLNLDRDEFTWIGNSDDTIDRTWKWNRESLFISNVISLAYQGARFSAKGGLNFAPHLQSKELLFGAKDDHWESWQTEAMKASLLKLNGEVSVSLIENIAVFAGATYRSYHGPEVNVATHYTNSNGLNKKIRSTANKVLEKGRFIYLGLKIAL